MLSGKSKMFYENTEHCFSKNVTSVSHKHSDITVLNRCGVLKEYSLLWNFNFSLLLSVNRVNQWQSLTRNMLFPLFQNGRSHVFQMPCESHFLNACYIRLNKLRHALYLNTLWLPRHFKALLFPAESPRVFGSGGRNRYEESRDNYKNKKPYKGCIVKWGELRRKLRRVNNFSCSILLAR